MRNRRGNADLVTIVLGLMFIIVTLICGLIAMRFILLLVGSEREVGSLANFVIARSEPFVAPFLYLVGGTIPKTGSVFEHASVLAVAAYGLACLAVFGLVRSLRAPKTVGYKYNVGREPRSRKA